MAVKIGVVAREHVYGGQGPGCEAGSCTFLFSLYLSTK